MKSSICNFLKATAIIGVVALAHTVPAAIMNYTFSGVGFGLLNGQVFSDVNVSISSTLDTSQITNYGNGLFVLRDPDGATVSVSGFGTGTFTEPNDIFATGQQIGIAGFDLSGNESEILDILAFNHAISTYDLSTPAMFNGYIATSGTAGPYATTAGDLTLNSWYAAFTATLVPEPGITAIYAFGAVAFSLMRRWTQRRSGN
jgi:hypothetical protein